MRRVALTLGLAVLVGSGRANADGEVWVWSEFRGTLVRGRDAVPSLAARAQLNQFYNGRTAGLGQGVLRLGLLAQCAGWLQIGTNFVASAERSPTGAFVADHRAEFEASLTWSPGAFTGLYRNRAELRVREGAFVPRDRNLVRVSVRVLNTPLTAFVWDELFVQLPPAPTSVVQNRVGIGLGIQVMEGLRVDVGYVFRSRTPMPDTWEHDHAALIYWLYELPTPGGRRDPRAR